MELIVLFYHWNLVGLITWLFMLALELTWHLICLLMVKCTFENFTVVFWTVVE